MAEPSNSSFKCVGLDVFVISKSGLPAMPEKVEGLKLELISERGLKVWPNVTLNKDSILTDTFRCRYLLENEKIADSTQQINSLLKTLSEKGAEWTEAHKLWRNGDQDLYSKAYG